MRGRQARDLGRYKTVLGNMARSSSVRLMHTFISGLIPQAAIAGRLGCQCAYRHHRAPRSPTVCQEGHRGSREAARKIPIILSGACDIEIL
ncbi:hypothetical protein PoB_001295000 [Plakobranchus ocellatus]|uniref:Uncharacterized protein n=1 Tax=Plakobranchus ocellatus TaxID=259542 RepID=A0AAV3YUD5_9GAST|nr:hypothetical protein PoB_001295000 [Plakobranchus ocellatus]